MMSTKLEALEQGQWAGSRLERSSPDRSSPSPPSASPLRSSPSRCTTSPCSVLLPDLRLLLRCKVVHDVELLADLLRVLPLDHGRHLRAGEVQETLDVQIVSRQDNLKEHLLLDVDVLGIPLRHSALDEVRALKRLLNLLRRIVLVVLAIVDDLAQNRRLHIRQGDLLVGATVVHHVLNESGHASDLGLHLENLALRRLQLQGFALAGHRSSTKSPRRKGKGRCISRSVFGAAQLMS